MVQKKQDVRLPPGWKVEVRVKSSRKFKCYINSKTHKKFYSKLAVLRYIKDRDVQNKRSSTMKGQAKKSSGKKQLNAEEANDLHEWLPSGWIVESRIRKSGARKGTTYKCFIDPTTGGKFFSKPEVYRYLESMRSNAGSSRQRDKKSLDPQSPLESSRLSNVSQLSKTRVQKSQSLGKNKVVVETTVDDELPAGWIKEIRNKMIGKRVARSDPFYFDPASGLVFRSKPDALRYIRTGEVSRHAYRRKNTSINAEEFASIKTSPPSSDESEKAKKTTTRKQLFTDKVSPKQCSSAPPDARGIKGTGSKRITRSSSRSASVHELSLEQSTVLQSANIAQEMIPEKSLTERIAATEATEGMTNVPPPKVQDIDERKNDDTHWESKPSTASRRGILAEKPETIAMKVCSSDKAQTSKRKMKDRKTPTLPSRSSKRLAGADAEIVFHAIPIENALRAASRKFRKSEVNPCLGSAPSESQEMPPTVHIIAQNGFASQEEKLRPSNIDTQTLLATQEESSKITSMVIDIVTQINAQELGIDLEEYPPGFPQNPRTEALPIEVDHSSVDPTDTVARGKMDKSPRDGQLTERQPDTLPESKIDKSSVVGLIPEEQQDIFPGSQVEKSIGDYLIQVERDLEHPESQVSLSSPLWSDPCLEFAYKTLTGALPLDDNLAINDYIQHQLRTSSDPSNDNRNLPDTGMPSFSQSHEPKPIPPFPEDLSIPIPNTNGFSSQRPSR